MRINIIMVSILTILQSKRNAQYTQCKRYNDLEWATVKENQPQQVADLSEHPHISTSTR